ncbi:MAG: ComEA family DNA-binding protein [Phycisphaerales bacterium JB064]
MTAAGPASQGGSARWVAALLISGVGLAGVGYSLATKPTPPTPPVVFVPQQVEARAGTPRPAETIAQQPSPAEVASIPPAVLSEPEPYEPAPKLDAGMTLDLNTATAEQLQLLPGIGPSRAAAIIENRTAMGPFRTVEDLARVRGIGPATVEGVRPYVTLSTPAAGGG